MTARPPGDAPALAAALRHGVARLGPGARLDAELLLAHALGVTREALLLGRAPPPDPVRYDALLTRRAAGEPLAYIVGEREFWSLALHVTPAVLIPRPDSETLVEAALAAVPDPRTILDLGTGSGALLLALLCERPAAWGLGLDRSAAATAVARANARRLRLADRAAFVVADWATPLAARFDLVVANPPYVAIGEPLAAELAHEPAAALFAGTDGLDAYRALVPQLPRLLAPAGAAVIEIGWTQRDAVAALAVAAGLTAKVAHDLAGRDRALVLTWYGCD